MARPKSTKRIDVYKPPRAPHEPRTRANCAGCQAQNDDINYQLWTTGTWVWEGEDGKDEREHHMSHLEEEVANKTELGQRLMARLYRAMDELSEISQDARGVGDFENASQAQMHVAKVVEIAARVGGVIAPSGAGAVVNVEQRSPLAVSFDVRKLADSYQRTAIEGPAMEVEEGPPPPLSPAEGTTNE